MVRTVALVCCAAVGLSACMHVDYLYRHEVAGTVSDPAGRALAGAELFRTDGPAGTEVSGLPELYRRTTGEDGSFLFEYTGLGGEPEPAQTWFVAVRQPGFVPQVVTLELPWVTSETDPAACGYVLRDVAVTLEPEAGAAIVEAPERRWVVSVDGLRLLDISDTPGILVDATAAPPLPGSEPARHPFLSASCGGDPLLCSRAGNLLRESGSLPEFLEKLALEGWTVEEQSSVP